MEKDTTPAFPTQESEHMNFQAGMTLRDYFAAKAMQGMMVNSTGDGTEHGFKVLSSLVCEYSYKMADAMLEARAK